MVHVLLSLFECFAPAWSVWWYTEYVMAFANDAWNHSRFALFGHCIEYGRTDRRGRRQFGWFFPRRGFKVADNDAPKAQRNERREERVVHYTQVDDAAGRVPATRHTVEISDSVLATMRRRAEWRRQLRRPLPLLMSSEKAKPIRPATTMTTTTTTRDRDEWWRSFARDWQVCGFLGDCKHWQKTPMEACCGSTR